MEQLFIGRKQILEELESRIFVRKSCKEYPMNSASLVGPMGIGKQTLLRKAIDHFEKSHHPGVHLFQSSLMQKEAMTVLLKDLAQQFAEKLTEETLRDIQNSNNNLLQKIMGIYEWFSKNEGIIINNSDNDNILTYVKNKFEELLVAYADLEQQIILIIGDFDYAKTMYQEKKGNASIFQWLFEHSQKSSNSNLKLNILLVCERRPQFIAPLDGSRFEVAFPSIVLHNFNEEEMEEYFQSFDDLPCGKLENSNRNEIVKYCGRFPQLLIGFRNYYIFRHGGQDIKEDIRRFTRERERDSLYHHICSLMESQWVDFRRQVTGMDIFLQYFMKQKQYLPHDQYMGELYSFGLVDKLKNGKYVPLTQIDTEILEFSLLDYVKKKFFMISLSTTDSDGQKESAARDGMYRSESVSVKASWLHLSDLHVFPEADTDFMLEEYRNLAGYIQPQFLIVTGDFRHKGQNTDFSNAEKFLNEILKIFHMEKEDVILVPGNHDADDSAVEREKAICDITENESNYNVYSGYIEGPFSLYRSFYEYDDFVRKFYQDSDITGERLNNPSRTLHFIWNNRLNVLCANTALISNGNKDHMQIVDINALVRFEIDSRYPTIMIGHHSIKSLYPEFHTRVRDLFERHKISAYLHGDDHQFDMDLVSPIDTGMFHVPSIACGKSVPQSGDGISEVGAIFYEWREDDRVYVKFYQWRNRKLRERTEYQPRIDEDYSFPMRY